MTKKHKLGCFITKENKEILDGLTKKLKQSQGEIIGELIENYSTLKTDKLEVTKDNNTPFSIDDFDLEQDERREVEEALINSNSQLDVVAKDGLLQRSRYLNSIAEKQAQLESMSDEQMQRATFKGAANYRIQQAIETIMNHNNNESEKSRKVCLTKGIVFKLTGSNRQTINKWFSQHQVMIDDHNNKHSLTDADNRKGKGFSFERLLGVE